MANDQQSYTGVGDLWSATSEHNRMDFVARAVSGRMVTATLVLVKAADATKQTVDVQPMVAQLDGAGNATPHGTINNLPVWRLQGGASAVIIDPAVGDIGLAVFAHTDISSVKKTKKPGNPGSRRRFDWSDGIYLGGLLNGAPESFLKIDADGAITIQAASGQPITVVGDSLTIQTDGDVTIDAGGTVSTTGDVSIGGNLTVEGDAAVTGDLAISGTSTLDGKDFATHTHEGVTVGTGTSGPPS